MQWVETKCGIFYLGEFSLKKTWVSIERLGAKVMLNVWFPGCQFSPKEIVCKSVEAAKSLGEKYMSGEVY